jgi:hypothetical protein
MQAVFNGASSIFNVDDIATSVSTGARNITAPTLGFQSGQGTNFRMTGNLEEAGRRRANFGLKRQVVLVSGVFTIPAKEGQAGDARSAIQVRT